MKQYYTYVKLDIERNISDFIFKEKINDFILPKHVYPMVNQLPILGLCIHFRWRSPDQCPIVFSLSIVFIK